MTKQTTKLELHDLDRQILGGSFRAALSREEWLSINAADFIGWLYETGRIDNWHSNGEGMVEMWPTAGYFDTTRAAYVETAKGSAVYTFQEFLSDCIDDSDVIRYLHTQSGFEKWVAKTVAQASPAREPETYTLEQEEALRADEYYF